MKAKTSIFTAMYSNLRNIPNSMYIFRNMSKVGDGYYVGIRYTILSSGTKDQKVNPNIFWETYIFGFVTDFSFFLAQPSLNDVFSKKKIKNFGVSLSLKSEHKI